MTDNHSLREITEAVQVCNSTAAALEEQAFLAADDPATQMELRAAAQAVLRTAAALATSTPVPHEPDWSTAELDGNS